MANLLVFLVPVSGNHEREPRRPTANLRRPASVALDLNGTIAGHFDFYETQALSPIRILDP